MMWLNSTHNYQSYF